MGQHLRQLEQALSELQVPLSDPVEEGESDAHRERELAILSRHLDSLESHLQALGPEMAESWRRQLQTIRERLRELSVGSDEPQTTVAPPAPVEAPAEDDCGSAKTIDNGTGDEFASCDSPELLPDVAEPAKISGVITDAVSGDPLSATVEIYVSTSIFPITSATTDETGAYEVIAGPPGTYYVVADVETHRGEVYDNVICESGCSPSDGTPIELATGEVAEDIDFALDRLGSISGRVFDETTGLPIPFAKVTVRPEDRNAVRFDRTDEFGDYHVVGLRDDSYFAFVEVSDYQDELYDNVPCLPLGPGICDLTPGTLIEVALDTEASNIDFALEPLGGIAGRVVHDATGEPIPLVDVILYDSRGLSVGSGMTDAEGNYAIGGINPGIYTAKTINFEGFVDELFDGSVCHRRLGCDVEQGTPIVVEVNAVTSGIDFALDFGGRVEGQVVATVTGSPVEGGTVVVRTASGRSVGTADVDADGRFSAGGLVTGTYFVTASLYPIFVTEAFDDQPCRGEGFTCDFTTATSVTVSVESAIHDIDFVLDRRGVISGTVTDLDTGEPLPFSTIRVWDEAGESGGQTQPNSSGEYQLRFLHPGTHYVTVEENRYFDELYEGLPCPGGRPEGCDVTSGTPVEVDLNTTSTIDFKLRRRPMGTISGVVRTTTGEPIPFARVMFEHADGTSAGSRSTDFDGRFSASWLSPGSYFVIADDNEFVAELYDNQPCPSGTCDLSLGTPIQVTEGSTTAGVDFSLTRLGVISGTVYDSLTGNRISATVRLWREDGTFVESTTTDNYRFDGLEAGTYFLTIGKVGFRSELYDDFPCPAGACDPTAGTPVVVELDSPRTGIDFVIDLEQGITGRVTDEVTGLPIRSALIEVTDPIILDSWFTLTGPAGEYVVGAPPGEYFVFTDVGASPFRGTDEIYDDIPCRGSCVPLIGRPVPVNSGAITPNIDFELTPDLEGCVETETAACLADDRFRVEVEWWDPAGNHGDGRVTELTDATSTFWFFGPENIEVVVKVLDACVDPFNRFWVFAAGLTDVGVEIKITDTLSGETKTYTNPLGTPFAPIQDTAAFSTCIEGRDESAVPPDIEAMIRDLQRQLEDPVVTEQQVSLPEPTKTGSCVPNATSLCLSNDRFRVESEWRTVDGVTGQGRAVELSDATGYFWFFSDDNIEALVKVLDACVDPFNHFWVFAAGLTDVEVALTVTDTESGEVRIYRNPLGTPFRPIQDTRAFDTCSEGLN